MIYTVPQLLYTLPWVTIGLGVCVVCSFFAPSKRGTYKKTLSTPNKYLVPVNCTKGLNKIDYKIFTTRQSSPNE